MKCIKTRVFNHEVPQRVSSCGSVSWNEKQRDPRDGDRDPCRQAIHSAVTALRGIHSEPVVRHGAKILENVFLNSTNALFSKTVLDKRALSHYYLVRAEVVELVDALRSGRSGSNPVGVQIPPSAPFFLEPF